MTCLQEASVAELAEVDGGLFPAIAVGLALGALCVYWAANEPGTTMTNGEMLESWGIKFPPK
jgi:hypothetical protein